MFDIFLYCIKLPCAICFGIVALVLIALIIFAVHMPEKLKWRYVFGAEIVALIATGAYYSWCNSFSGFGMFGEGLVATFALAVYFLIMILSWLLWRGQNDC